MNKIRIPRYFYNLRLVVTRPQSVQRDEIIDMLWTKGAKMRGVSVQYKGNVRGIYFDKQDTRRCYEKIMASLTRNYPKHLKQYKKAIDSWLSSSRAIEKSVSLSNKHKTRAFKGWLESLKKYYAPIIAPFAIEEILDNKSHVLLEKEFGKKADEAFAVISSPTKLNIYQKMRIDIDNLAISRKVNDSKLKKMVKKYSWYNEYSFVEPFWGKKHFQKEIKKLNKKTALEEKNHILKDTQRNKKLFLSLKKKIKNPKLKLMATILNSYVFLRTDRIEKFKLAQARIRPLFKSIANDLNKKTKQKWNHAEIANFTNQEIIDFLEKGEVPKKEEIKKRINQKYVYYSDGSVHISYDPGFIMMTKKAIFESEGKSRTINGLIAFKGIVKGKVVMIHDKKDLRKVKKGMILVAKTTMPDYTQAMKKAASFVTEEGGITSHTAIISRELKKPCIVATGNCTKVLKDGNLVEVDANKGIVKILKRK